MLTEYLAKNRKESAPQIEDPLPGEIYRGIDIKLDYVDYNKRDKKQDKLTVERVVSLVEGILWAEAEEVLTCEKENLHLYCLFNYSWDRSKSIRSRIHDILSAVKDYLMGFEQYEVTIGVGTERSEFGEIRFSIKEANRAVGNRIKLGTGRVIYAVDDACIFRRQPGRLLSLLSGRSQGRLRRLGQWVSDIRR